MAKKSTTYKRGGLLKQIANFRKEPMAATIGAIIGGIAPVLSFAIAHKFTPTWRWAIVAGALLYSATSVWEAIYSIYGRGVKGGFKATGFVVILEAAMVAVPLWYVYIPALLVLVGINAVISANQIINESKSLVVKTTKSSRKAAQQESAVIARGELEYSRAY